MSQLAKKIPLEKILEFEQRLSEQAEAKFGNCYPLKHSFADGIYIREIRVPAGELIVTRTFKQSHATFLLFGEVSIVTEKGIERVSAPHSLVTSAGVKRVIYTHTDVVWTTVHSNPSEERDIEILETQIADDKYKALQFSAEERRLLEMAVAT